MDSIIRSAWLTRLGTPLLFALVLYLLPASAEAAGLFIAPRGVRPLARGGAMVAGAQGVDALSYNPAGLGEQGCMAALDLGLPLHRSTYTRRIYGATSAMPAVSGSGMNLPLPTLGVVHNLGLPGQLHFGLGFLVDYPLLQNWPDALEDGSPAPQRYAIKNYHGTSMAKAVLGAAYRFGDWLSVGAAFQVLVGRFSSQITASACDGVVCTQPEDQDYDADIQMLSNTIAVPGAHVGLLFQPVGFLRFGAAWETGYTIETGAKVRMRMPDAAAYDKSLLDPQEPQATLKMRMPMQARAGIAFRHAGLLEVEAAAVWQRWSEHEQIEIDPHGALMRNVLGFGDYALAPMIIERRFQDTISAHLGAEIFLRLASDDQLSLRAGIAYEPSAAADAYLSPMNVDLDRIVFATGASYATGAVHLDLVYSYVHMFPRTIQDSKLRQINPTRPLFAAATPIGNGTYTGRAHIVGLGLRLPIDAS